MKKLVLFKLRKLIGISLLCACPAYASANVEVALKEPDWKFLLDNQPPGQTEARLEANESSFARQIQPLLAAQNYSAVLKAFEGRDIANDSAALRLMRGQVLLSLRRTADAEQALKAALTKMPDLAMAHRSLSMAYMLQKNYKAAREHLRRSIELGVADVQVYGQLAFINLQLGQPGSAVAGYQQALFLEPDNGQWQQGLLYALINSQAFDQAQALLEQMLDANPANADLWLQRGQIALRQQRPEQALASLEAAIQLGNVNVDNLALAAQLHIQNGSPKRAVELLASNMQRFVAKANGNRLDVVDQIGAWLAFQQDWNALDTLLRAVERYQGQMPAYQRAHFEVYRAQHALARGNGKQAHTSLERALAADPTNGEALLTLANTLGQQKRSERALLYYVRAEALPEFKERALLGHAQLEIDRKNYGEALRVLRQVVQNNPARGDVIGNIQLLENLVRNQG